MMVTSIPPTSAADAVTVLCDAFHDYPVMRYILGFQADYDGRLHTLVSFFVAARTLRQEPVLGIYDPAGTLAGAATVTLPEGRPSPPDLLERREAMWAALGVAERRRYEQYSAVAGSFSVPTPHHHLNMVGVRPDRTGRGLARKLVEAVHALADADVTSSGVSLNTESESNVAFYQHLGYHMLGHARVAEDLQTWAFFKPTGHGRGTRAQV